MGHVPFSVVYVGIGRLPQPLVSSAPTLAVEIEVDLRTRAVVAVSTNLGFPCLDRLLVETLVGRDVGDLRGSSLLEIDVRYSAPFTAALGVAVQNALRRATEDGPKADGVSRVPDALAAPGESPDADEPLLVISSAVLR